jgi:hypothetical protein
MTAALAASLSLTACQPEVVAAAPAASAPQVVPVPQAADSFDTGDAALGAVAGAAAGYMLGKAASPSYAHPPQPQTVVVHQPPPQSAYYGQRNAYTTTTTTVRRSGFGGKTVTTTRTVTRGRR